MSFSPAILAYVPPPNFTGSAAFLANITRFKTKYPMMLFSDHRGYDGKHFVTPKPFTMYDPEKIPPDAKTALDGKPRACAISNAIFHTALKIAIKTQVTHMLYMEADCRVNGDYWDDKIFSAHFSQPFPAVASGTLFAWNMPNGGTKMVKRWEQAVVKASKTFFPILTYGMMPHGDLPFNPSVFPNGAIAVYSIEWMRQLFNIDSMIETARDRAFDFVIGEKLARMFGPDCFDLVAHTTESFSGYGNQFTSEDERLAWLKEGRCVAVHQVKSDKTI